MTEAPQRAEEKGKLKARHVIAFVIAAAAPLGFAAGAFPIAIGRGGTGYSGVLLLTGLLLIIFAVGYVTMARYLDKPGGLYAFVRAGLGSRMGDGASYVAGAVYALIAAGSIGAFAVFANQAARNLLGVDIPWTVWAAIAIIGMAVLGYRNVDLGAKVLGIIISLEIGMLLLVSLAIIVRGGAHGLTLEPLAPSNMFGSSMGTMFAISLAAFAGFEATVMYADEVTDRTKTIRRATYGSVALLAIMYAFAAWAIVMAYGTNEAVAAANADPINLFFSAASQYLGPWASVVMQVLVVSSWFATILAFHNAAARYFASMGHDRLLPRRFAKLHPKFGSPYQASLLHTGFTLAFVLLFIVMRGDPYLDMYIMSSAPAVIGVPLLEILASIAVFAYFLKNSKGHALWRVRVAPLVAALGLMGLLYAICTQMPLFTGREGLINILLPGSVIAIFAFGYFFNRSGRLTAAAASSQTPGNPNSESEEPTWHPQR